MCVCRTGIDSCKDRRFHGGAKNVPVGTKVSTFVGVSIDGLLPTRDAIEQQGEWKNKSVSEGGFAWAMGNICFTVRVLKILTL